ncbi:DUF559 domain-containing protein [Antrihabitans sp. YC2-6]|nr:DUF559 domain-containing protein [Antrihabitans sp. YC2-6]
MAAQDGVVTLAQAVHAGMSESAVSRRVCAGDWRRLSSGVYLRADRAYGPAARLRAAVFAAAEGAIAYGPSAAWWRGLLDKPSSERWVTVPARRRTRPPSGVRMRRRDLDAADVGVYRGLLVTNLPLTVLESAVELPNGSVFMDRALQNNVRLAMLRAAHERNLGRWGSARAAALLHSAGAGGHSEAERMLHRLLRGAGIIGWRQHVNSCGFEIDVAFGHAKIAIEVDGWAWHRDAERFVRDAERQNILVNAGWVVLQFTWHQLTRTPEKVLATITAALTADSARNPVGIAHN